MTDRQRTEKAELGRAARIAALADATFAVMWSVDRHGVPVGDHARWTDFTGQAQAELASGRWKDAVHPSDRDLLTETVAASLKDGASRRVECRLRRADGEWRRTVVRTAPIRDDNDVIDELVLAAVDVTERQRAEEALLTDRIAANEAALRAQARTRALFQGLPAPLFAWEERGGDFVLTDYNDAAAAFSRGNVAKLLGQRATQMYHDAPDIVEDLRRCFDTQALIQREMQYRFRTSGLETTLVATYAFIAPNIVLVHTEDITERRRDELELERSERELRELTAHVDRVREEERANLARNLHDDLGQSLTALKMDLRAMRRQVEQGLPLSAARLDAADQLVDGLIASGRRIVAEIRSPFFEELGLRESVESQAADFSERIRIRCTVVCTPRDLRVDERTAMVLYRIVQESLTNVARHAAASSVTITMRTERDCLVLQVEDNGRGITTEVAPINQFGIIGMRERALALGGEFAVRGAPRGGTVVEVTVPVLGYALRKAGT